MVGSFADAIERRALNIGIDQGYAKGIDQGIAQGITQGMDNESRLFAKLYKVLNDQGKKDELEKAVFDPEYKKQLYRLYNIT